MDGHALRARVGLARTVIRRLPGRAGGHSVLFAKPLRKLPTCQIRATGALPRPKPKCQRLGSVTSVTKELSRHLTTIDIEMGSRCCLPSMPLSVLTAPCRDLPGLRSMTA